jgi:hypothetical protein
MREVTVKLRWCYHRGQQTRLQIGDVWVGEYHMVPTGWAAYGHDARKLGRFHTEAEAKAAVEKAAIEALEG